MTEQEKEIERLSLETRAAMVESGDFWISPRKAIEFASRFLAAVDAERGKEAVAWLCEMPQFDGRFPNKPEPRLNPVDGWKNTPLYLTPRKDGWRLVPVEPTLDMGWAYLDAARESSPEHDHMFNHPGYKAMLAAAPTPEEGK